MSCGNPHETDCREVIEAVYLYLDGEMGGGDRDRIQVHLEECRPCLEQYGLDEMVKIVVARCCASEHAPDELRVRLLGKLRQLRISFDSPVDAGAE